MTTKEPRETSVSVTLSVRDWIVIGSVFVGLVAWGVRLEMRITADEKNQVETKRQIEKLEDRLDRISFRRWSGPIQDGQTR